MPFLTNVAHGFPSYDAIYNNISSNFIFANYGGSQGFDTDDGSAWHNIESNFYYSGSAYKNDYGGYNVNYINNMNVALRNGNTATGRDKSSAAPSACGGSAEAVSHPIHSNPRIHNRFIAHLSIMFSTPSGG